MRPHILRGLMLMLLLSPGLPSTALANPCHDFPWELLPAGDEPAMFTEARTAQSQGLTKEFVEGLKEFIRAMPEHPFVEAARFALAATVNNGAHQPDQFLDTIGNLQAARQRYPESRFSPWALCTVGDLYRQGGWYYEAKGTFEQFLNVYPGHSLTPGVLNGAGLNFLGNEQSLEAALVFRRVLDDPTWKSFHLEAALGLADGAAESKAWDQARYWYETVAMDSPELLRASSGSLYRRGVTEWELGNREKATNQFLTAFNLYPNDRDGGRALIHLARSLSEKGADVPSLWFAHQAIQRFPQQEPEYVGRGVLLGWTLKDLRKGPDAVFNSDVRPRLSELGIAVPVTWNEFREEAAKLSLVTKPEISGMARLWIAQSYDFEGQPQVAFPRYIEVVVNYSGTEWEHQASEAIKHILDQYYMNRDWVSFLTFFDTYPGIFALLNPETRLQLKVAEGYMAMQLPKQALTWVDRVIGRSPPPVILEEALGHKVRLAQQLGNSEALKAAGVAYENAFPEGPQLVEVASSLANLSIAEQNYSGAMGHYSKALSRLSLPEDKHEMWTQILSLYRLAGQWEKTIAGYRTLLRDFGQNAEDVSVLGDILFERGRYQEAIVEYHKVDELHPSPMLKLWATYRLAVSHRHVGNVVEAKHLLKKMQEETGSDSRLEKAIKSAASAQEIGFMLIAKNEVDRGNKK